MATELRQHARTLLHACMGVMLLLGAVFGFAAILNCASASSSGHVLEEVRLKSALDVLREVITPASAVASDGCLAKQRAAVADAREGTIAPDEAKARVAAIRTYCDELKALFGRMRLLHDEAATFLETGQLQETEARVRELRDAWKRLDRGGGGA